MKYIEKLKDPRWQKKRLEILNRDEWYCQKCFDNETTLNVHHRYYLPKTDPWDYPESALIALCENCHSEEKDHMPKEMSKLIFALKKQFLSEEVFLIANLFNEIKLFHAPEVFISVIEYHLLDESRQRKLIDEFFDHLSEKTKERKSCQETG